MRVLSSTLMVFQSTLSVRRATGYAPFLTQTDQFQSTLSVRRATFLPVACSPKSAFQSTLSVRRATNGKGSAYPQFPNFNPRSP